MTQNIFAFPFATPYEVQIASRSFINARICSTNSTEFQLQNTTLSPQQQANIQNQIVSSSVTAVELPTGTGKSALSLSAAFHAQNVVAHQNLILEKNATIRKIRQKRKAKLLAKQRKEKKANNNNNNSDSATDAAPASDSIKNNKLPLTEEQKRVLNETLEEDDFSDNDDDGDLLASTTNNGIDDDGNDIDNNFDPDNDTISPLVSWQNPGRDFVLNMTRGSFDDQSSTTDQQPQFGNMNPSEKAKEAALAKKKSQHFGGSGGRVTPQLPAHIPRILFLSRTHSQIKEITRELRKFKEASGQASGVSDLVSTAVMASRREYCLHSGARAGSAVSGGIGDNTSYQSGNITGEMCDKLVKSGACTYQQKAGELTKSVIQNHGVTPASGYQILQLSKILGQQPPTMSSVLKQSNNSNNSNKHSPVWDIEDLLATGQSMRACPYYTSRDLIQSQRCTFAPYNYLLDPIIRHETKIEKCIKGSIVVIDEAHNIADVLQDSFSFQYILSSMDHAIETDLLQKGLIEDATKQKLQQTTMSFQSVFNPATGKFETRSVLGTGELVDRNKLVSDSQNANFAMAYPKNFMVKGAYKMSQVFEITYKALIIVKRVLVDVIARRPTNVGYGKDPTMRGTEFMKLLHREYVSTDQWGNVCTNNIKTPSTIPSPFIDPPQSRLQKKYRNSLHCPPQKRIVGNYELDETDPGYILEIVCSCWMTFGVTFNPFEFSSKTMNLIKVFFLGLLNLVKFPESYCVFKEDVQQGAGGNKFQNNNNNNQNQAQQQDIQLHLRCLDPSIGWRHLRRTTKHILLMSGTLGDHNILARQLGEKFDLITHALNTETNTTQKNANAVQMNSFFYQPENNNNSNNGTSSSSGSSGSGANLLLDHQDSSSSTTTKNNRDDNFFDKFRCDTAEHERNNNNDDDDDRLRVGGNSSNQIRTEVQTTLPHPTTLINTTKHVYDRNTVTGKNFFRGSHVVDPTTQARALVVTHLENGMKLECTYANRTKPGFMPSLARTLATLINNIPHGCLVFCPSYAFLKDLFFEVRKTKIIDFKKKSLLMETTGNTGGGGGGNSNNDGKTFQQKSFQDSMDQYRKDGEEKSACMMCVFRGKVSEGINLPDNLSRGVICVGIPLRMTNEPAVCAQRTYMSGTNWYNNDAVVAVNQAIGRALRHRQDYGAIILLDARFANAQGTGLSGDYGQMLPGWLRRYVKICGPVGNGNHIQQLGTHLKEFFRERELNNEKAQHDLDYTNNADNNNKVVDLDGGDDAEDDELYSMMKGGFKDPRRSGNNNSSKDIEDAAPFQKLANQKKQQQQQINNNKSNTDNHDETDSNSNNTEAVGIARRRDRQEEHDLQNQASNFLTGKWDSNNNNNNKSSPRQSSTATRIDPVVDQQKQEQRKEAGQSAFAQMMMNGGGSASAQKKPHQQQNTGVKERFDFHHGHGGDNNNTNDAASPAPQNPNNNNANQQQQTKPFVQKGATLWRPGMTMNTIEQKKKLEEERQQKLREEEAHNQQNADEMKQNLFSGFKKASQIDIDQQKQLAEDKLRQELGRHQLPSPQSTTSNNNVNVQIFANNDINNNTVNHQNNNGNNNNNSNHNSSGSFTVTQNSNRGSNNKGNNNKSGSGSARPSQEDIIEISDSD